MFRLDPVTVLAILVLIALIGSSSPAEAANCGAKNQRPCKLWEGIPSCNKGLYEDFGKGKCLQKHVAGKTCGRKNQVPCPIWVRVPSCNTNLKEDFAQGICVAVNCGKENGPPCTVIVRIPSCDSGLVEDFLNGKCVKSENAKRQEIAGRKLAEIAGFVASKLHFAEQVAGNPSVRNALNSSSPESVSRAVNTSAVGPTHMPDGNILRTLSVGASVGAKVFVGGSAGAGGTVDLSGRGLPTYAYATADYSLTLGFGVEAGIDVGLWVCQANKIGGDSWGVEFGPKDILALARVLKGAEGAKLSEIVKPGLDVGITLWFGYDGSFQGFAMTPGVGVGADLGGVVFATTAVEDDPKVNCNGTPVRATPVSSSPAAPAVHIQDIRYTSAYGNGVIRHRKTPGGANNRSLTRVCLTNSTGNPKSLDYSVRGVNPLNAARRGDQSCANFPSNMRLNFAFVDRGQTVKPDAMNLSAYAGDIVMFEWLSD